MLKGTIGFADRWRSFFGSCVIDLLASSDVSKQVKALSSHDSSASGSAFERHQLKSLILAQIERWRHG
jgi:hypothetical protein